MLILVGFLHLWLHAVGYFMVSLYFARLGSFHHSSRTFSPLLSLSCVWWTLRPSCASLVLGLALHHLLSLHCAGWLLLSPAEPMGILTSLFCQALLCRLALTPLQLSVLAFPFASSLYLSKKNTDNTFFSHTIYPDHSFPSFHSFQHFCFPSPPDPPFFCPSLEKKKKKTHASQR